MGKLKIPATDLKALACALPIKPVPIIPIPISVFFCSCF
jgi:hypothetical protein